MGVSLNSNKATCKIVLIDIHFSNQKEEEIEKLLRKKYADSEHQARSHFGDGGEEMSDEITQQTLLPGIK